MFETLICINKNIFIYKKSRFFIFCDAYMDFEFGALPVHSTTLLAVLAQYSRLSSLPFPLFYILWRRAFCTDTNNIVTHTFYIQFTLTSIKLFCPEIHRHNLNNKILELKTFGYFFVYRYSLTEIQYSNLSFCRRFTLNLFVFKNVINWYFS